MPDKRVEATLAFAPPSPAPGLTGSRVHPPPEASSPRTIWGHVGEVTEATSFQDLALKTSYETARGFHGNVEAGFQTARGQDRSRRVPDHSWDSGVGAGT